MQLSHCESQKWSNLVALSIQTEDSDSWRMWVIRIFMSFPHRFVSQLRAWFQIRLVCRVAVTTRSRCDDDDDDDDSSRAAKTKSTVAYFYSVKDFSQSKANLENFHTSKEILFLSCEIHWWIYLVWKREKSQVEQLETSIRIQLNGGKLFIIGLKEPESDIFYFSLFLGFNWYSTGDFIVKTKRKFRSDVNWK